MANYECRIRTNYFHVNDEKKFLDLMDKVRGSEDAVNIGKKRGLCGDEDAERICNEFQQQQFRV